MSALSSMVISVTKRLLKIAEKERGALSGEELA